MALGEKIVININFKELKIESVSKSFPGVQALDSVSMKIASGKVHALMGENGAGKSTLIKILAGAYSKDSGDISFDENKLNITKLGELFDDATTEQTEEFLKKYASNLVTNIFFRVV